jgi:hypothetical protein
MGDLISRFTFIPNIRSTFDQKIGQLQEGMTFFSERVELHRGLLQGVENILCVIVWVAGVTQEHSVVASRGHDVPDRNILSGIFAARYCGARQHLIEPAIQRVERWLLCPLTIDRCKMKKSIETDHPIVIFGYR